MITWKGYTYGRQIRMKGILSDVNRYLKSACYDHTGQFPAKDTVYEYYVDVKQQTWVFCVPSLYHSITIIIQFNSIQLSFSTLLAAVAEGGHLND